MPTNRLVEKEKVATYAQMLFDASNEAGKQAGVMDCLDELEQIVKIIRGNAALSEALSDKAYTPEQRNALAKNTFGAACPAIQGVLGVMSERLDMGLLNRACTEFSALVHTNFNITIVDVTTVVELDNHLREVITKKVAADFGTEIVLREHIDSSIIGGILLSANGKRIDASILSQLENARVVLKQSADGGEC